MDEDVERSSTEVEARRYFAEIKDVQRPNETSFSYDCRGLGEQSKTHLMVVESKNWVTSMEFVFNSVGAGSKELIVIQE